MRQLLVLAALALAGFLFAPQLASADDLVEMETIRFDPGVQVIRWLGGDEVPLSQAVGAIEDALFGAAVYDSELQTWKTHLASTLGDAPTTVSYGDWLAFYLLDGVEWERPIEPAGILYVSPALPASVRSTIHQEVRDIELMLEDRFGFVLERYDLFVAHDYDDLYNLQLDAGVTPQHPKDDFSICTAGPGIMLTTPRCGEYLSRVIVKSQYRHFVRDHPLDRQLQNGLTWVVTEAARFGHDLEAMDSAGWLSGAALPSQPLGDKRLHGNQITSLAAHWLASTSGERSLWQYFVARKHGLTVNESTSEAFGVPMADLLRNFASYRKQRFNLSGDNQRIFLLGSYAHSNETEVLNTVEEVEQWFKIELDFSAPDASWLIDTQETHCGINSASPHATYIAVRGVLPPWLFAHEFFHLFQFRTVGVLQRGIPYWMTEGSAMYIETLFEADKGVRTYESKRQEWTRVDWSDQGALSDIPNPDSDWLFRYYIGALAFEWLVAHSGEKSVADYYRAAGQVSKQYEDKPWTSEAEQAAETVFAEFWGLEKQEFYDHFECWRARGFPAHEAGQPCDSG